MSSELEHQRGRVESAALAFARMKLLGSYMENGVEHMVHKNDRESYQQAFHNTLMFEAEMLLRVLVPAELPPRGKT